MKRQHNELSDNSYNTVNTIDCEFDHDPHGAMASDLLCFRRVKTMKYDFDVIKIDERPRHGSPQNRGSADAYYGRPYNPHYYVGATTPPRRVGKENMTVGEIEAYKYGYDNEKDRMVW